MDSKYFKIFAFISLLFIAVVISAAMRIDLFKTSENTSEEKISLKAKNEINRLFYEQKAIKLDSLLQDLASKSYFNGNILVGYKGECIYNKSFGYSDLRNKKKLEKDDIFQLASVSKQFTAMAIMILKEQNKLSYDDSVAQYITDFPYPDITIRMLLNHTSGLPNYMWLVEHHWKGAKAPYNDDILKLLAEHKLPLYFKPGRRWDYSNTGYIVLAGIVEKISGKRFGDFMHQHIFEPLKMENSFIYSTALSNPKKDKLIGYQYRGKRYRMIPETVNDGAVGDKGVYSTAEDLYKWDRALYENTLVSSETFAEAISSFKLRDKYDIPYGFGFRISQRNNKKLAYHHGRWNGFRTSLMRYVEDTNTVIVLNHTSSALNGTIIRKIQEVLYDSLSTDITHLLVQSVINHGDDASIEDMLAENASKSYTLDTLIIKQASRILYDTNNPAAAERLLMLNKKLKGIDVDSLHKTANLSQVSGLQRKTGVIQF